MKKHYIYTSLMMMNLSLLCGCASLPYQPIDLSSELQNMQSSQQNYSVDTSWWRGYNNAELNRLIDMALTNNPDYIRAAINVNKELYNLNLSNLDLFPTLNGSLGASSQREIGTHDNFASNFTGEIGLNYEVDLYGKIRNLRDAQEFELKATLMDRETAKLSLVNSVVDLYFNLEYLNNAIVLSKKNVETYQNIQNITEAKYKSGQTDNLEFLESKQSLLSEKNKLLSLETQYKEMETSLKNILNNQELVLNFGNMLEQQNLGVNMDVPLAVLAKRPDLQASQYRLEKAFKNLEAENKNWYPSISLNGALGSSSDKARTTFDFPFVLGSVSVDLPFLDWNRVNNNIKISEADYQLALVDFKDSLNQAVNEVGYYYTAYAKALNSYGNTEQNYLNAVEITKYYQTRYNSGKIEFKDYLEAIHKQISLQDELIQQKYQIIKYENYVYKAMSGKY